MNAFEKLTLDAIVNPRRYSGRVVDEVSEGFWMAFHILEWIEEESR